MVHLFEHQDLQIAYHRESGDFYQVDPPYQAALKRLIETDFTPSPQPNSIERELLELFANKNKEVSVPSNSELEKMLYKRTETLNRATIMLTSACNMRCRYCYEGSECMPTYLPNSGGMSMATLDKSLDFLVKTYSTIKNVMFFGGEPLLQFNTLKAAVERIETLKVSHPNLFGGYGIITNGTLMTQDVAEYFKRYNIAVTLSCDGPADIHDLWRVDEHKKGTWERVNRAALLLKNAGVDFNVQAAITPDHLNMGFGPASLTKGFSEWGVTTPHVVHAQLENAWTPDNIEAIVKTYQNDQRSNIQAIETGNIEKLNIYSRFVTLLQGLVTKGGNPLRCPAGIEVAIDPNGTVFPCFMFASYADMAIGNVATLSPDDAKKATVSFMKRNLKSQNNECSNCWASRLCSGCMGANLASSKSLEGNETVNCSIIKASAEGMMHELARLQENSARWSNFLTNWKAIQNQTRKEEHC